MSVVKHPTSPLLFSTTQMKKGNGSTIQRTPKGGEEGSATVQGEVVEDSTTVNKERTGKQLTHKEAQYLFMTLSSAFPVIH